MWLYVVYLLPVLIAAGQFIYWYITRTFNYWKDRDVPYPEPVPLFGNIKRAAFREQFIGNLIKDIYEQFPNEKVVGIFRMTSPCILLRDPDIIKQILIKDFDLFAERQVDFSDEGLGRNLFQANADMWRVLRTKFSPLFTSAKLKNMYHLIDDRGDRFIEYLKENYAGEPEIRVLHLARKYTISSIAACAFGMDIDYYNPGMEILEKFDRIILEDPARTQELVLMFPRVLKKLSELLFPGNVKKFFYDLVKTVFEQRNNKPSGRKDFMDLILEMREQKVIHSNKNLDNSKLSLELDEDIIAAQVFIFYLAGFETSSTVISFLLHELTQHLDIQQRVIDEVDEVVIRCNGKVTYEALMDMPYLSAVFDETLRKYPIVDPLIRCAMEDYKIPGTNVTVPKGMSVLIPVQGLHYDKKYFPDPEKFDPERFSSDNAKKVHSCCYLPFGQGPRNCIGMRFGKVQSKLVIVKLLTKYRVESSESTLKKVPLSTTRLILGPADGVPLKLVSRVK